MSYRFVLIAGSLGLLAAVSLSDANVSHAQEEDDGFMSQAFGKGNGVRGTVTAAGNNSFTLRTEEGDAYRVLYSENTRLVKDRQPIEANEIHVGDMLVAGGVVDAKAKTVGAVLLLDVDAKQVQDARSAFGKSWVAGKVTGIHDLKITIERADDKHAQVLEVDENTSFLKRRENVTLADIKVGDFVTAQGAIHADMFLASTLRVVTTKKVLPPPGF